MKSYTTIVYGEGRGQIVNHHAAMDVLRKRNELWNKLVRLNESFSRYELDRRIRELGLDPEHNRKELFKRPDVKALAQRINAMRLESANAFCRESKLYWPNYSQVMKNFEIARRKDKVKKHEFDGTGLLTVHYQNGIPTPDVFSGSARHFKIVSQERHTTAKIRIGTVGKEPIWFEIPIVYHRPIPYGKIRDVSFKREYIYNQFEPYAFKWKVIITVELSVAAIKSNIDTSVRQRWIRNAAIEIGCRRVDTGLRVAVLVNHLGENQEFILPDHWLSAMEKADDIGEIRKTNDSPHLHEYESNLRHQQVGSRLDLYRNFAANICDNFDRLVVHESKGVPEASLATLYSALINAADKKGVTIERVTKVTNKCNICGKILDQKSHLQECGECGTIWDTDVNTCMNMLWGSND